MYCITFISHYQLYTALRSSPSFSYQTSPLFFVVLYLFLSVPPPLPPEKGSSFPLLDVFVFHEGPFVSSRVCRRPFSFFLYLSLLSPCRPFSLFFSSVACLSGVVHDPQHPDYWYFAVLFFLFLSLCFFFRLHWSLRVGGADASSSLHSLPAYFFPSLRRHLPLPSVPLTPQVACRALRPLSPPAPLLFPRFSVIPPQSYFLLFLTSFDISAPSVSV